MSLQICFTLEQPVSMSDSMYQGNKQWIKQKKKKKKKKKKSDVASFFVYSLSILCSSINVKVLTFLFLV